MLPLVVLVSFIPQPELLAAMSEDRLIPTVFHEEDSNGVFRKGGLMAGAVLVVVTLVVPFEILWNVISLGVILSFNITNTSLIMLRCGNGGKIVSNRTVRYWAQALWVCGIVGAYFSWNGLIDDVLNGDKEDVNKAFTAIGILGLVGSVVCVVQIDRNRKDHLEKGGEKEREETFKAAGVPYVPGFAIVLNFFLTAQFGLKDHAIFGGVMGVCVGGYFLYKTVKHFAKRDNDEFTYEEYFKEQNEEYGRCRNTGEGTEDEADRGGGGKM